MPIHHRAIGTLAVRLLALGIVLIGFCVASLASAQVLGSYNAKIDETSVSGISSGAFMAVQIGVAHSANVKGVGATAGGPYFCGEAIIANELVGIGKVFSRCMQGDPAYPATPITAADLARMYQRAGEFAARGWIDPLSNLARQKVAIFHGYNDGIVKQPVSEALYTFYAHYAGPQVFYKDNLPAGHAQITDRCPIGGGQGGALTDCACRRTGDEFIKNCNYDAAGVLLRHIYGNLAGRVAAPSGQLMKFSQRQFTADSIGQTTPNLISMGEKGYVYVPASCATMKPCRVHIALHGCLQYAENPVIGDKFARYAGYNEWADANNLIILYPQATANWTMGNPQGCWDWWGYAHQTDKDGKYATKDGLQLASIWRMLERLTSGYAGWQATAAQGSLSVTDVSDRQVALRWGAVTQAVGYNVYRSDSTAGPYSRMNINGPVTGEVFVDVTESPGTSYFYLLKAVNAAGKELAATNPVQASTGGAAPACDPYFSLAGSQSVTKMGVPTNQACP